MNPHVGCSLECSFCNLPAYGIPTDQGNALSQSTVDTPSFGQALQACGNHLFIPGASGTLLSIGSFTEPFLTSKATLALLLRLSEFGNPVQLAARLFPGEEVVRSLEDGLGAEVRNLMINLSMNDPEVTKRLFVEKWLLHKGRLNITIYAKPFLDRTRDCLGYFEQVGREKTEVSFVVGSLYFSDKMGLSRQEIANHRREPALKSPVVPHSTTPGMRNNSEEEFRRELEGRLGRTVFRTSSCALATKMQIPEPLDNFDGPFYVDNCPNRGVCQAS